MGQHGFTDHVADRENVRFGGLLLRVAGDKASSIGLDLGVFEPNASTVGATSDGDKYAVVKLGAILIGALESNFDLVTPFAQGANLGVQVNAVFHQLCQASVQRFDQVAISAG